MADEKSLYHRELARRAQDIHRVKNPTDTDYKLIWDGYVDTIPSGGTADLETYKMDKYLREMGHKILRERQEKAVIDENKRRRDRGEKEMDKWVGADQHILEGKFAVEHGINSPEALSEVYKTLYVGLVREYGVEKVQREENEVTPTTHEAIMEQILGSRVPENESKAPIADEMVEDTILPPLSELKQPQLRKIAREKGLEESKTDKKQELIERISKA